MKLFIRLSRTNVISRNKSQRVAWVPRRRRLVPHDNAAPAFIRRYPPSAGFSVNSEYHLPPSELLCLSATGPCRTPSRRAFELYERALLSISINPQRLFLQVLHGDSSIPTTFCQVFLLRLRSRARDCLSRITMMGFALQSPVWIARGGDVRCFPSRPVHPSLAHAVCLPS